MEKYFPVKSEFRDVCFILAVSEERELEVEYFKDCVKTLTTLSSKCIIYTQIVVSM